MNDVFFFLAAILGSAALTYVWDFLRHREDYRWRCRRCREYVRRGRCQCEKSPSPWERV